MLDIIADKMMIISQNAKYVATENKLYRTTPQTRKSLKNIADMLTANQNKQFMFSPPHVNSFFMSVLPKLYSIGRVEIPDSLKEKIISDELKIISKFDKEKNNIRLDLQLQYGGIVINQATIKSLKVIPNLLIRDHKKESDLQSLFYQQVSN